MKTFIVTWYSNKDEVTRHNKITANHVADASVSFARNFGNLKKNTIISFQEIDKDGNPIGEPIVPED